MDAHFHLGRTGPAAIGRAALEAQRWSGMSTARVCAMMQLHGRGIHRTLLADQMVAVAKPTCEAQVEMGYSIASLFNRSAYNRRSIR
jgi:hypothetical protein